MDLHSIWDLEKEVDRLREMYENTPSEIRGNKFSIKKLEKHFEKGRSPVASLWGIKIYLDSGLPDNIIKLINKNKVLVVNIEDAY